MDRVTFIILLIGWFSGPGLAVYYTIYSKPLNHINQFRSLNRLLNRINHRITMYCTKIKIRFKPVMKVIKPVIRFKPDK